MNGQQLFTLLTLAIATVLGLAGVTFAYLIATGSPRLAAYGIPPIAEDTRVLVAVLVAVGGFFAASMLVTHVLQRFFSQDNFLTDKRFS